MTAAPAGRDSILAALAGLAGLSERFKADAIRQSAAELSSRLQHSIKFVPLRIDTLIKLAR